MPRKSQKTHKGLLKRIRITGTGKVNFKKSKTGHLRSKKAGTKILALRRKSYAKPGDKKRLEKMLSRHITPVE